MRKRYDIDRDFLRGIATAGRGKSYADSSLRGFAVKISALGRVSYTVRWQTPTGAQRRLTIGYFPELPPGRAREIAIQELRRQEKKRDTPAEILERRRLAAKSSVPSGITLETFIDEHYGPDIRVKLKRPDEKVQMLKTVYADLMASQLDRISAKQIDNVRITRLAAGIKISSVETQMSALRGVFSRAVKWKHIHTNPMTDVEKLDIPDEGRVRWLHKDEEERLRHALHMREQRKRGERARTNEWRRARRYEPLPELGDSHYVDHLFPAVLVAMNTGLRLTELLKLEWSNVDLQRAMVTVKAATAKGVKVRHVPLNREALDSLTLWKGQASTGARYVFPNPEGGHISSVKKSWTALRRAAKLVDFKWHDLRHHFASWLVMGGVDLNTVRELLGHSDIKMTLRYAHLAPEYKAAAVAVLMNDRI